MRPAKILLVDDKPENILALEAVLRGPEYILIGAHSGKDAVRLVKENPDLALILLDVQMPIMDGFEVARRVKELPEGRDVPIIFVTAIYTEDPFIRKGFQAGGVDYFSKPFDPEILKLKVALYAAFRQKANLLKERERQIQESEEILRAGRKLSTVLESLPVGVIIADSAGRICQTNEEILKVLKSVEYSRADSYGTFLEWWEQDGRLLRAENSPLMRALTQGQSSQSETMKIRCFDGSAKSVFVSASPLRGHEGHTMGAVVLLQDATEHKKVEHDFERRIHHLVSLGVELEEAGGKLMAQAE